MKKNVVTSGITIACTGLLAMLTVFHAYAAEVDTVMLPLEVYGRDVISVALPAISEESDSPFDFIIDPQGLIYETDAAKYGGGRVEEGATLLFRNHDGDYDFSRYSDRLRVRNQSNVPTKVTITASVSDLGEVEIVGSPDFYDDSCSIYLAIVDDDGNEQPVSEDGEVSVSVEMMRAPDDAYYFRYDEESGEYSYEYSTDPEYIDFDTYSFGLVGYCNPNGNWEDISVHPKVNVTWNVEPLLSEEEEFSDDSYTNETDSSFVDEEIFESDPVDEPEPESITETEADAYFTDDEEAVTEEIKDFGSVWRE